MFVFFSGASLKFARNLIQVAGLKESLAVIRKNSFANVGEVEALKLLLAVDACNLLQTMMEEDIARDISEDDRQDTVEDYLVENLKDHPEIPCRDGAERMEQCQEILKVAAKFQEYWTKKEAQDPGPRFYVVKETLRRLGCEANTPIHDNLFEFVYIQHKQFELYFRTLLDPFDPLEEEDPMPAEPEVPAPEVPVLEDPGPPAPEPPPVPAREEAPEVPAAPPAPDPVLDQAPVDPEMDGPWPGMGIQASHSHEKPRVQVPLLDPRLAARSSAEHSDQDRLEDLGDILSGVPVLGEAGGEKGMSSKPTPQMLDDLFKKVNPVDPGQKKP